MPATGINHQSQAPEKAIGFAEILSRPAPENLVYAKTQFKIIKKYILDFQASLDSEHDIGILLTSFGQSVLMEITEIGYENPVLMIFRGYVNGRMSTLIQHVNQLNFLLTSVSKAPSQPKRTIGFTATWAEQ